MKSITRNKLFILQAFRGIAAILVVLYHTDLLCNARLHESFLSHVFYFGFSSVDFFFVLSGFIICYAHYSDIGKQSITKFKYFLLKRFIRIFPTYWLLNFLLVLILFSSFTTNNLSFNYILSSFLLLPQKEFPIIVPSWTLTCEIFFYLIFSSCIFLERKFYSFIISFFLLGSIIGQFVGNSYAYHPHHYNKWIAVLFGNLNLEFALGCLSAFLVINNKIPIKKLLLPLGVFLFTLAGVYVNYSYMSTISTIDTYRLLWFGIPSFLIITGSAHINIKNDNRIINLLIYFGNASYAIYLIHMPLNSILSQIALKLNVEKLVNSASLLYVMVAFISISFGCLYYSLIEKRLLHFLNQLVYDKPR